MPAKLNLKKNPQLQNESSKNPSKSGSLLNFFGSFCSTGIPPDFKQKTTGTKKPWGFPSCWSLAFKKIDHPFVSNTWWRLPPTLRRCFHPGVTPLNRWPLAPWWVNPMESPMDHLVALRIPLKPSTLPPHNRSGEWVTRRDGTARFLYYNRVIFHWSMMGGRVVEILSNRQTNIEICKKTSVPTHSRHILPHFESTTFLPLQNKKLTPGNRATPNWQSFLKIEALLAR